LQIVALQEIRWKGQGQIKKHKYNIKMGGWCEERSGKYGSEKLETEGAGEETMERNNWASQKS